MRLCFAHPPGARCCARAHGAGSICPHRRQRSVGANTVIFPEQTAGSTAADPTATHEAARLAHIGSCSPDSQHDAQVNRRHSLCCRCQRRLQSFDIRTQIRLPAAGTTAFGAMLIGDFLVDSSEGRRGETHHRHGRELGDTKDIAERHHDGTMHLCAGRFAVRIWLHKSLRPLPCSRMADGRAATMRSEVNSAWSAYARDRYALMQPPSSC